MRRTPSLVLLFILVFSCTAICENDRVFSQVDFHGGLNTHTSPYVIPENQCVRADNIRFNHQYGSIGKRGSLLTYGDAGTSAIKGLYRYYNSGGDKILIAAEGANLKYGDDDAGTFTTLSDVFTSGQRWMFATYKDNLIGLNGAERPVKWDGKTTTTANTDGSRTASNLVAELGAPYAELNTGAHLDASSWYQYKVAFYDGSTYSYSTARSNPILTGTTVTDIALTDIPIGPSGTTHRYVYRTLGNASRAAVLADATYYLVADIADNTTTTLSDAVADGDADDDDAPTLATVVAAGFDAAPPIGAYPLIHQEQLFIAGNPTNQSDIYWSDDFNPQWFDPDSYEPIREDDGDKITFIRSLHGILVIGKEKTIQNFHTSSTTDTDWYYSSPFSHIGCVSPHSVADAPIGIIYSANDGIYVFDGASSSLISDVVTQTVDDMTAHGVEERVGVFAGGEYHLGYTSSSSGSTYNDKVLVLDVTRNSYSLDDINAGSFCVFGSGADSGVLYVGDSTTGGNVYAYEAENPSIVIDKKSEFDLGTSDDVVVSGTEAMPIVQLGWDCTIDTWLTELQAKDASINTIDDIGTYLPSATIDRPDTSGTWISPVYRISSVSSYDKMYWNENLGVTGDISAYIRSGASAAACAAAAWSSAYTDPSGSDISSETAAEYVQFKIAFSTTNILYTPSISTRNGFAFKMTYLKIGSKAETSINTVWESGWNDFGIAGYKKLIERIRVFYTGTSGILSFNVTGDDGDIDKTFTIDLSVSPSSSSSDEYTGFDETNKIYTFYAPANSSSEPSIISQFFKYKISESGNTPWTVQRIETTYVVQELY